MYILLLILLMSYQIIETIVSVKEINKLIENKINEKTRLKFYCETIICGWIPVIIISIFIILKTLTIKDIGFNAIKFSDYTWLNVTTIVIISIISLVLIYQMVMFIISKKYREAIKTLVNKKSETNNHYDRVINEIMIPITIKEKTCFFFVSLTAAICEEITWRGALIFLIQSIFPLLNITIVVIMASAIFGIFHSYQGLRGVIKTGLIGVLFNLLYLISNSLILGMIIHFLFDFSSAFILTNKPEIKK